MAAERLSKLQKFILTTAYKKTVLKERLPKCIYGFKEKEASPETTIALNDDYHVIYARLNERLYFSALYESDIMFNFYNRWTPDEKYGYEGGSNKEKTALRRSLKTLYDKGYINDYTSWYIELEDPEHTYIFLGREENYKSIYYSRAIITLTQKGKTKAEEFLKL